MGRPKTTVRISLKANGKTTRLGLVRLIDGRWAVYRNGNRSTKLPSGSNTDIGKAVAKWLAAQAVLMISIVCAADRPEIAAEAALADATAREDDVHFYRWVWVRSADADEHKAAIFVPATSIAHTRRGAVIPKFVSLGEMKAGALMRLDLYRYAPRETDRARMFGTFDGKRWTGGLWESLAEVEPYFLALQPLDAKAVAILPATTIPDRIEITDATVQIKAGNVTLGTAVKGQAFVRSGVDGDWTLIDFPKSDGTLVKGWIKTGFTPLPRVAGPVQPSPKVVAKFIRAPNVHCAEDYAELQSLTGSLVPVVEFTWLMRSLWFNNEGPKDGTLGIKGQYYEWRGIRAANEKEKAAGLTDFDVFNARFGADWREAVKEAAVARVVISSSAIAGKKPRLVDNFAGRLVHPTKNQRIVSATFDASDRNVADPQFDGTRVLDEGLKFDAMEVIAESEQGVECALFNGKFELVRVVPPDVAADHLKQEPYTKELEVFGSCMFCHNRVGTRSTPQKAGTGENFWKRLDNEGPEILSRFKSFDPLKQDRLESLYGANTVGLDNLMERMRDAFAAFTRDVTDLQPFDVSQILGPMYAKYWREGVDEKAALFDLGVQDPLAKLEDVLLEVEYEDPVIDSVLRGRTVHRETWLNVLPDALRREWLKRQEKDE